MTTLSFRIEEKEFYDVSKRLYREIKVWLDWDETGGKTIKRSSNVFLRSQKVETGDKFILESLRILKYVSRGVDDRGEVKGEKRKFK